MTFDVFGIMKGSVTVWALVLLFFLDQFRIRDTCVLAKKKS
jgi:hypothetical protein